MSKSKFNEVTSHIELMGAGLEDFGPSDGARYTFYERYDAFESAVEYLKKSGIKYSVVDQYKTLVDVYRD